MTLTAAKERRARRPPVQRATLVPCPRPPNLRPGPHTRLAETRVRAAAAAGHTASGPNASIAPGHARRSPSRYDKRRQTRAFPWRAGVRTTTFTSPGDPINDSDVSGLLSPKSVVTSTTRCGASSRAKRGFCTEQTFGCIGTLVLRPQMATSRPSGTRATCCKTPRQVG